MCFFKLIKNRIKTIVQSRIGFSLMVNIVTALVAACVYHPFFEENDDVGITMLAEGIYGAKDSHLIISSTVLGKILVFLQNVCGCIRWHAVLQYLFLFVGFTALTYILSKDKKGRTVSLAFILASFYECYVALQFTKTTMVVGVIGYLILFYLADDNQKSKSTQIRLFIAAYACLVYAMILREKFFYVATGIMGIYGIVWLLNDKKSIKDKAKYGCIHFIPVFIALIILSLINLKSYDNSSEWNGYLSYNLTRAEMNDFHYRALDYDIHGDELKKLGVSENDAYMYLTWQIADDTVLTKSKMKEITALDTASVFPNIEILKAWVANMFDEFFVVNPLIEIFVILGILYIGKILSDKDKERKWKIIGILSQLIVFAGLLYYYQVSGRWNHRPVFGLLLAETILMIYSLNREESGELFGRSFVVGLMGLLIATAIGNRVGNEFDFQKYQRSRKGYDKLVEYIEGNKDCLFVADTFTVINPDKFSVFKASKESRLSNYVNCGSWYMNSPIIKNITRKYGYDNPFEALESRSDKVLLIDNCYPERKLDYCIEHGDGNDYKLVQYDTIGGYSIYKLN